MGEVDQAGISPPLAEALADVAEALEREEIPYVVIGGVASLLYGRPRVSDDLDILVAKNDAERTLDALASVGFDTERTNDQWIYKGFRDGVQVDVIFWLKGDFYLDDEMLARARRIDVGGRDIPVVPPEDLIVVKAIIHDEQTPRHWGDALALVANCRSSPPLPVALDRSMTSCTRLPRLRASRPSRTDSSRRFQASCVSGARRTSFSS